MFSITFQLKTRLKNEQETVSRALRDADARFTALTTRITQQVSI